MTGLTAEGFLSLTGPSAPRVVDCRSAAMLIKSALRDWLSMSYGIKSITSISHLRWLFPPLVPYGTTFPLAERWDNKDPRSIFS